MDRMEHKITKLSCFQVSSSIPGHAAFFMPTQNFVSCALSESSPVFERVVGRDWVFHQMDVPSEPHMWQSPVRVLLLQRIFSSWQCPLAALVSKAGSLMINTLTASPQVKYLPVNRKTLTRSSNWKKRPWITYVQITDKWAEGIELHLKKIQHVSIWDKYAT